MHARVLAGLTALAASALMLTGLAGTAQAAYHGNDGLIAFVRSGNIYTINPEASPAGPTTVRLTRDGHDSGPRWSPNGKQIAYLDRGNLWIMNGNGSHKKRITDQAPAYYDSRPTWSPDGRYLAFVKSKKNRSYGYLTRYDTVTHKFNTFSTPYHSEAPTTRQIKVTALAAPVAWAWAAESPGSSEFGSFIMYEGATSPRCGTGYNCLELLGFPAISYYRNGFPSLESSTLKPISQLDPDWYPINPVYYQNALATQEKCTAGHCTYMGINLATIYAAPSLPGAYQAVWSPNGLYIAFVKNVRGKPEIYTFTPNPTAYFPPRELTTGTEPDWQPVPFAAA
jgi:WD40-like Beta Propeller Repeat